MFRVKRLGFVCLLAASSLTALAAPRGHNAAEWMSHEERLVRAAYAKMAAYSRASYASELNRSSELADELALRFELRDFKTARIDERLSDRIGDLVTLAGGEVISGAIASIGEDAVAYNARWAPVNWSTLNSNPALTVGELLARESADSYDIGKYTSYEVTVTFEGRSRTYRAMAVFHDRFESEKAFAPVFVDQVVGLGGELTDLASDRRVPFQSRGRRRPVRRAESEGGLRAGAESSGCNPFHDSDTVGHSTGTHGAAGSICNTCTLDTGGVEPMNECSSVPDVTPWESGTLSAVGFSSHAVRTSIKMDPGTTAPANQPVSCQSGVAAAVFECGMFGCRVGLTVGVSGHGADAQATIASIDSNAVWSLAVGGGTTCPAHNVRIGNGTMPRSGAGGGDGPAMDLIPYEVCYVYEEFWIVNGMRIDPPIYTQVLWCE